MYGLGSANQNLPGFVAMCPGGQPIKSAENWQSAFLPGAYQGTYVDSQHTAVDKLIENIRSPHASPETQRKQLDLLRTLNEAHRRERLDPRLEARIESFELAFRMQTEAADAFDISREPQLMRDLYGSGVHGRQTLIARRLIERGVRFVQLWHGAGQPWDNHDKIEESHRKLAGEIDQPIAALLTDLEQRGMLDDTLVIWGGEFGRTPTVEMNGGTSKLGRDHNHYGFTRLDGRRRHQRRHRLRRHGRIRFRRRGEPRERPRSPRHHPASHGPRPRAPHLPLLRPRLPADGCGGEGGAGDSGVRIM